jgi:membrane protease YdiL (CAAX protease family)
MEIARTRADEAVGGERAATTGNLDTRGLAWFIALAYAGAWLVVSPLWLSGRGLETPFARVIITAMMFTPALATLLVVRWLSPLPDVTRATGLVLGRPGARWWPYWLFGWLAIPLLVIAAPFVGALFGLYPLDLAHFSGYRALLERTPGGATALGQLPIGVLVLLQLVGILWAPILNAVFAFGEEWGWRGYLLPRLLPLGRWPALVLSGVIWGLWHAPVILLGYNYPLHPRLGVLIMVGFCVVMGVLFGWTRLATGSIWPAVIAHGALNGAAGVIALFPRAGAHIDTAQVGITGWTGWLLPLACIAVIAVASRQAADGSRQ